MISDNLNNISLYDSLGPGIRQALQFLASTDFAVVSPGCYEIGGSDLYVIVMEYQTKPIAEGQWEAHREYIDVQFVAKGVEIVGCADVGSLSVTEAYDESKDCLLLEGKGQFFQLREGSYAIFWPQDAHMPSLSVGHPKPVLKVVVKVRI